MTQFNRQSESPAEYYARRNAEAQRKGILETALRQTRHTGYVDGTTPPFSDIKSGRGILPYRSNDHLEMHRGPVKDASRNYRRIGILSDASDKPKGLTSLPGIRNRNPMNMKKTNANWPDKTGVSEPIGEYKVQFDQFGSDLWGIRAGARNARTQLKRRGLGDKATIFQIMSILSPAGVDGNPKKFPDTVAKFMGKKRGDTIDTSNPEEFSRFVDAVIKAENHGYAYNPNLIRNAVELSYFNINGDNAVDDRGVDKPGKVIAHKPDAAYDYKAPSGMPMMEPQMQVAPAIPRPLGVEGVYSPDEMARKVALSQQLQASGLGLA